MLYLLALAFVASLLVSVGASAWFTRRLEVISDLLQFTPGLLSLLGALGANIPNYVASLTAAASGQVWVGIGIIIGSNIYNIAIILGISTFASPVLHGITLARREAQDARVVGVFTLAMMLVVELAIAVFSWRVSLRASYHATLLVGLALTVLNLLALALFSALSAHALQRTERPHLPTKRSTGHFDTATKELPEKRWLIISVLGEMIVALCIALIGVIMMVRAGETFAGDVHMSPVILSLIVLAIATSLPNTVVAFTLARTGRASASIEEIFSSNSVNAALGIAVPLLFWSSMQQDRLVTLLDGPLMVALTLVALLCVLKRRVSRVVGLLLILLYAGWIVIHMLL